MASNALVHADDHWMVEICENLHSGNEHEDLQTCPGVCVCRVPISLSSAKPEAFIPQFVGLGPYHHSRNELIMSDKLKLGAAKRILKDLLHLDNGDILHQRLKYSVSGSDVQPFYQEDGNFKQDNHHQPLWYILTVDGLFLLGMLHIVASATANTEGYSSYFLTGKHGIAPVNAAGVELTMDAVIRDIFMLENQIPTHFLKQIMQVFSHEIQSHGGVDKSLGLLMQKFCEALCPLVHFEKLSKDPEAHDHLLDLMYHLISPEPESETEPKLESELESKPELEPEPKPESEAEPEPECKDEQGSKDVQKSQDKPPNNINTCCSKCLDIIVFLVILGVVVGFIVKLILNIFLWVLRSLFRMVQWALRPLYVLLVNLSRIIYPVVDMLYDFLNKNEAQFPFLKAGTSFVGQIRKTSEEIGWDSTKWDKDARPAVTIPSVTELHNAGIHFQAAEGSISSTEFDEIRCRFYLPSVKLDVNSEVIMRNLVAYESLTKYKGLMFTRYIELMRAIIDTPLDVQLLVRAKIIQTELSDEVVAQLFNGMSKSIKPTKTPELEQVIKKVNAKFDSNQTLNRVLTKYLYSYGKFFTVVAALVFLALTAVQTYCSVFYCFPTTSRFGKQPIDGNYYRRNNYFISSI